MSRAWPASAEGVAPQQHDELISAARGSSTPSRWTSSAAPRAVPKVRSLLPRGVPALPPPPSPPTLSGPKACAYCMGDHKTNKHPVEDHPALPEVPSPARACGQVGPPVLIPRISDKSVRGARGARTTKLPPLLAHPLSAVRRRKFGHALPGVRIWATSSAHIPAAYPDSEDCKAHLATPLTAQPLAKNSCPPS